MRGVMDGKTLTEISKDLNIKIKEVKTRLVQGMKMVDLKTIRDLVHWGLTRGIIVDQPTKISSQMFNTDRMSESHPAWVRSLEGIIMGGTPQQMADQAKQIGRAHV